jgi:hypothetical protein
MSAKAPEPRTMMKMPTSLRDEIKRKAKQMDVSMMDYVKWLIDKEKARLQEA